MTYLRALPLATVLIVGLGITPSHAAPDRGELLLSGVPISMNCAALLPSAHPVLDSHKGTDLQVYRAGRQPELSDAEWLSQQLCGRVWQILSEAGAHPAPTDMKLPSRTLLNTQLVDIYLDGNRVVDQRIDNNLWPVSVPHWSLEMTWRVRFQVQYGSGALGPALDLVMRGSSHQEDYQNLEIDLLLAEATNEALSRLPGVLADEGRLGELLFTLRSSPPSAPAAWGSEPLVNESFALLLSIEDKVRHAALAIFLSSPKLPLESRRDLGRWFAINEPSFAIQRDALSWYMQQEALAESGDELRPEALELISWLLQRASSHRLRSAALLALKGRKNSSIRKLLITAATDKDPRVADVALSQLHNFKAATANELAESKAAPIPRLPAWTRELDGRLAPSLRSDSRQLLALSTVAGGASAALWRSRWLKEKGIKDDDRSWILEAWTGLCGSKDPALRLEVLQRLVLERDFLGVDELITERAEQDPDTQVRALALLHLKDGPRQLSAALSAASGPDPLLRKAAATALSAQRDSQAELRLRAMSRDDPDRKVRGAARKALRKKKKGR
jgi:HEAT repeat protein